MTCQCITCQWILTHEQPRGKGLCWKSADAKPQDVMAQRKCGNYKLGAMHQVQQRMARLQSKNLTT